MPACLIDSVKSNVGKKKFLLMLMRFHSSLITIHPGVTKAKVSWYIEPFRLNFA